MKKTRAYLSNYWQPLVIGICIALGLFILLGFRLGTLVGGISSPEHQIGITPVGWHGIWHQPLDLPLELLRSIIFKLRSQHGALFVRIPSALIGAVAILSVTALLKVWHGTRIAFLGGILFATASWTLHVSRLGSNDVLYLSALPILLLVQALLQRRTHNPYVYYGSVVVLGLLLYTPGLIWLLLLSIWLQREKLLAGWRHFNAWWQRTLYIVLCLTWLPLLILGFLRNHVSLRSWIGLPARLPTPLHYLKELAAVFVHIFIRGPEYPQLWLGRAPLLDAFTLAMCIIGIYFYATHIKAARTRLLAGFIVISVILIALGGTVPLSLIIPIVYIVAASGIAYLLHSWLKVFPVNPFARNFGIAIVVLAVAVSCIYNLRSYFIAWPNDTTTPTVFYLKD